LFLIDVSATTAAFVGTTVRYGELIIKFKVFEFAQNFAYLWPQVFGELFKFLDPVYFYFVYA